MKRSNRLVILVGVLLAVLAFVGIVFLLNNGGPDGSPTASVGPQATVLVAKVAIAQGEAVTPDKVEAKQIDPAAVIPTALVDPSQVNGRAAVAAVARGQQVTAEIIGGAGSSRIPIASLLQPGEKAIAFQVDRVTGLDFLIQPGDYVDVVMRQDIPVVQPTLDTIDRPANEQRFEVVTGLEAAPTVKTVLQNKRVLYVSATNVEPITGAEPTPSPGTEGAQPPELTSIIIIIAGTDQDAEVIKLAQSNIGLVGSLTAVLRAAGDVAPETTTGVTISLLISKYGVPVPDIVLLERQAP